MSLLVRFCDSAHVYSHPGRIKGHFMGCIMLLIAVSSGHPSIVDYRRPICVAILSSRQTVVRPDCIVILINTLRKVFLTIISHVSKSSTVDPSIAQQLTKLSTSTFYPRYENFGFPPRMQIYCRHGWFLPIY